MLRSLVLILVLANAGYLGWSRGWLDGVVSGSQGDREPQRLSNQVRPEIVRILPPSAAGASGAASGSGGAASGVPPGGVSTSAAGNAASPSGQPSPSGVTPRAGLAAAGMTDGARGAVTQVAASSSGTAATACVEAGPFNATQLVTAQSVLHAAAVDSVAEVAMERPGVWMLYMGRYVNQEAMSRKVEELKRRRLEYQAVTGLPEFEPGLSLGRFDSRTAADEALVRVGQRAVRTARVVQVAAPATLHWLRQVDATPARQKQLIALRAPALGEGFAACGTSPAVQALPASSLPSASLPTSTTAQPRPTASVASAAP